MGTQITRTGILSPNTRFRRHQLRGIPQNLRQNCLIAYYKLDETSGPRFDSGPNAIHLTDVNTVGSDLGVIGNSAYSIGLNQEYLTATNSLLSDANYTISLWFRAIDGVGVNAHRLVYRDWFGFGFSGIHEYSITYTGGAINKFIFEIADNTFAQYVADFPVSIDPDDWYHVVATFDGSQLKLYVNNVAGAPTAFTGTQQNDPTAPFIVGMTPSGINDANSLIDELGLWCRVLSDEEIDYLYCNRNGVTYPFNASDKGVGGFSNGFNGGFWGSNP